MCIISRIPQALRAAWQEHQPSTSTQPGLEVTKAMGSHRPQGPHECGQPPQGWRVLAGRAEAAEHPRWHNVSDPQ